MHLVQPVAWVVALGTLLVVVGLLARALRRHGLVPVGSGQPGHARAGHASSVRSPGWSWQSFTSTTSARVITVLAGVALALDAVDGWVARRLRSATPLGRALRHGDRRAADPGAEPRTSPAASAGGCW